MDCLDVVSDTKTKWLQSLMSRGLRPRTIQSYEAESGHFLAWLKARSIAYDRLTVGQIEDWMNGQRERGNKARSVRMRVAVVKSYYKYLLSRGYIATNPLDQIEQIKVPRLRPKPLSMDIIDAIIAAMESPRNKAIFEVMYSSGARVSELAAIELQNVDLDHGRFLVIGKGGSEGECFLTPRAIEAIREYLKIRGSAPGRLFLGKRCPITMYGIRHALKAALKRANLSEKIHTHQFRHSTATHLYQRTRDLMFVAKILRHKQLTTTQGYADICRESLYDEFVKAHPRADSDSLKREPEGGKP